MITGKKVEIIEKKNISILPACRLPVHRDTNCTACFGMNEDNQFLLSFSNQN